MPDRSPHSFRQIADVLGESLKTAFDEVCPERYGTILNIRRIDEPLNSSAVSFEVVGAGQVSLQIDVTMSHVGGNVYDIITQVEDGPERCFTYSEPGASGSSLSIAPYLGRKIARHLLDEVEQQLGRALLRNQRVLDA